MQLDGKVALITGSARGQGAAEAELFAANGAKVIVSDVLDDLGAEVARRCGPDASYVHLDVTRESDWAECLGRVSDTYGGLDILVNNAGIMYEGPLERTSVEDFLRVTQVNQVGPFLGMKSCLPLMAGRGRGSIVNVSSDSGLTGETGFVAYAASKWAVRGMTKVAALEYSRFNIRVNSVHPGPVRTAMIQPADDSIDLDALNSDLPIPRVAEPIEIAKLVMFVASDDASYSTGCEFVADGGFTAGTFKPEFREQRQHG